MRITGRLWKEHILHSLGATSVAEIRDPYGRLLGYDVEPDIDINKYAQAESEYIPPDPSIAKKYPQNRLARFLANNPDVLKLVEELE
jgi:hypothetical protein